MLFWGKRNITTVCVLLFFFWSPFRSKHWHTCFLSCSSLSDLSSACDRWCLWSKTNMAGFKSSLDNVAHLITTKLTLAGLRFSFQVTSPPSYALWVIVKKNLSAQHEMQTNSIWLVNANRACWVNLLKWSSILGKKKTVYLTAMIFSIERPRLRTMS